MSDVELKKLEHLVDELVKACVYLKQENWLLREKQAALVSERAKLIEKNDVARMKVESMIQRLKTLEHLNG